MQPDNLAAGQGMSTDMLKEKMKKALDELAEKQEVFIIVIDAINQVIWYLDLFMCVSYRNSRKIKQRQRQPRSQDSLLSVRAEWHG